MSNLKNLRKNLGDFFHRTVTHPLFILLFFVYVMWNTIYVLKFSDSFEADFDAVIILFISFVSFIGALTMLLRTRWDRWTILSSGLFGFFVATCVLYSQAAYIYFYGTYSYREYTVDVIRSLYAISSAWVLIGLIQEWWYEQYLGQASWKEWLHRPIRTFRSQRFKKEH